MRRASIEYSAEELAWIERHKTMIRREAYAAFCEQFGRRDLSFENYHALCKRKGWHTGRTGRLEPGNVPANKGQKMPFNANCAKTQFKKGQLPHNTKYVGHERVNIEGYVEISIDQANPHTGFERRYVHKQRYLWEQLNGPVPDGKVLKCLDGNKQNTDPSNWELIDRAILPRLNGRFGMAYDQAEPEVKPAIMMLARLKHAVKQRMVRK